jgi:hypothetical protein
MVAQAVSPALPILDFCHGLLWRQQNLAESVARELKGVLGVTNNIEVRPRPTPAEFLKRK